ncbi:MAG: hypothetical protein RLZZ387_4014 [Chloroflexota bacterium]
MTHHAAPRPSAPLIGLHVLAAAAAATSGFVAPGSLVPPAMTGAGAVLALALAALTFRPLRRPVLAPYLAAGAVLALALLGILAALAGGDVSPEPPRLLGGMGPLELAACSVAVALAACLLAALCPQPLLARALAGLAVAAPGLLALVWLLAAAVLQLTGGVLGLAVAALFTLYLALVGAWGFYLRRSHALELVHEGLGQAAAPAVLTRAPSEEVDRTLEELDAWLDPLGEVRALAGAVVTRAAGEPRYRALTDLLAAMGRIGGVLPRDARADLSAVEGAVPEARIALAADAWVRRRPEAVAVHLAELELAILTQRLSGLGPSLDALYACLPATPELLALRRRLDGALLVSELDVAADRPQALQRAYLALEARGRPLDDGAAHALAALALPRPEAHVLLAEDAVRRGGHTEALLAIGRALVAPADGAPWLRAEALWAWDRLGALASPEVQRALGACAQRGDEERAPALAVLALVALEVGLTPARREAIAASGDEAAADLLALDDLRQGRVGDGAVGRLTRLSLLPSEALRERVLPRLCAAARIPADEPLFFRRDRRPQLLEVIETPPTSIYGGRITVWSWRRAGRPVRLSVTGQAPAVVCARVSAILNDLVQARGSGSDLLLAGAAFFDLIEEGGPTREAGWDAADLERRVLEQAGRLNVTAAVQGALASEMGRTLVAVTAGQPLHTTVDGALEALREAEREMGFVEVRTLDVGLHDAVQTALLRGAPVAAPASFPVLVPYRSEHAPLRVRLPVAVLGVEEYQEAEREYWRGVVAQIRAEWERRSRKYEELASESARQYRELSAELAREGAQALATRTMHITARITLESLVEEPVDPPEMTTALDQLERLPDLMLRELAFWALAEHRLHTLPTPESLAPAWARTCLLDAFLRGWPLPITHARLNAARETWEGRWRPLALAALGEALAPSGLSLRDIAVENTVFRIVREVEDAVELELLHVFDPWYDTPPKPWGVTLFQPQWGARRRTLVPAEEAQRGAVEMISRALQQHQVSPGALRWLAWDSGAALDLVLDALCAPLRSPSLARDVERVLRAAMGRSDPMAALRQPVEGPLALARLAGDEGRLSGALPDLLAFELHAAGHVIAGWAGAMAAEGKGAVELARLGPWGGVRHLVQGDRQGAAARAALEASPRNKRADGSLWLDTPRVLETYKLLKARDPEYAERCLAGTGFPAYSRLRRRRSVPTCFRGSLRAAYYIADGDAAAALAYAALSEEAPADAADLQALIQRLQGIEIPAPLVGRAASRDKLVAGLERLLVGGAVDVAAVGAYLRQSGLDATAHAESAYRQAAAIDTRHGDAWLRLARLLWLAGRYRAALETLAGPVPRPTLASCRLPLALAVRAAGAELRVEIGDEPWPGPAGISTEVAVDEGVVALAFYSARGVVGSCTVEGLSEADAGLLAELFSRHSPAQLKSTGEGFEDWLRLVAVPGLGQRGEIARIAADPAQTLLAAMVYLGVPATIGAAPGAEAPVRPDEWLRADVVTHVAWLARMARTA